MAGDQVQWIVEGGTMRVGVFVRGIPAGEIPALPAGVGKQRRAFRARAACMPRVLVRDLATGLYHAPLEQSLEVLKEGCEG